MASKTADPVIELLKTVDLFEGLDAKHLKVVRGVCREHSFAAGDTLVEEGGNDRRFFLIVEGTVDLFNGGRYAKSIGPGGYFGEIAVLDEGPRTATIKAATAVQAVSIASFSMKSMLKENPAIVLKLLLAMCGRVRNLTGISAS
jgi:CRP-like cAMP-binding protein